MTEVNEMKNKTDKRTKERMIHIRLDDNTHRQLKINAVQNDTTIQQLVEDLILRSFVKARKRKVS